MIDNVDLGNLMEITVEQDNNNNIALWLGNVKYDIDFDVFDVVESYLNNNKINGIMNINKILGGRNKYNVVYGYDGNRMLKLRIFDIKYSNIHKMVLDKYLQDRYNYCWNEEINNIRIEFSDSESRYDRKTIDCNECNNTDICLDNDNVLCDAYDNFILHVDRDGNISDFEKKFINDLLMDKLWKIGEKAFLGYNFNVELGKFVSYEIECGNLRIVISDNELMEENIGYILDIVREYNAQLINIDEDVKKRQLKMEGF